MSDRSCCRFAHWAMRWGLGFGAFVVAGWPLAATQWPDLSEPAPVVGGGERDVAVVVGVERYAVAPPVPGASANALAWSQYLTETRKVPAEQIAFLPAGGQAVSASADGTLKLWDLATGRELRTFRGHVGGVTAVAVSPDGTLLASTGQDGILRLWNVATGEESGRFVAYPQGEWVVTTPQGYSNGSEKGLQALTATVGGSC